MYLSAGDGRPARLSSTDDLINGNTERRGPHGIDSFDEFLGRTAWGIRFPRTRIIDYFPCLQVTCNFDCGSMARPGALRLRISRRHPGIPPGTV